MAIIDALPRALHAEQRAIKNECKVVVAATGVAIMQDPLQVWAKCLEVITSNHIPPAAKGKHVGGAVDDSEAEAGTGLSPSAMRLLKKKQREAIAAAASPGKGGGGSRAVATVVA
eukprot:5584791-Prymnesium_polylepis.1